MKANSVVESEHKQLISQQHEAQAQKGRSSCSHTEPSGDQLSANAATETRGAMAEDWYERVRARHSNDMDQIYNWAKQAEEKCRRQKEDTEEIRHQTSTLLQQKDQHIAELTKRLNDLQYQPDVLNDDEVIQTMAKLCQQLDVWVKGSFKDPQLLQNLSQVEFVDVPYTVGTTNKLQNMHQKWAFIRAFVTSYLFYYFFDTYMVGLRNLDTEYTLMTMELEISDKCPGNVADNWRSATSIAIQSMTKGDLEGAGIKCMRGIEQLGSCASVDTGLREKKLYELLESCVDFKRRLERQPARHEFTHTSSGDRFMSEIMESLTGQEGDGAIVEFSLWPGLWKGDVLLHPETVWSTMDKAPASDSNPGTEMAPTPQDEAGVSSEILPDTLGSG